MAAQAFDDAFDRVKNLAATFEANEPRYLSTEYQEAEARKDFIDKLFIALGWDVNHDVQTNPYAQEVKVERAGGSTQRRADYAFYLAPNFRDVRFYVEAKKPHGDLATPDNYFQATRYGYGSGNPLAVLTDFQQFHILDCRYRPDIETATHRGVAKYHYSQYTDRLEFAKIYWLFSREAVASGSIEKYARDLPKPRGKAVQRGLFPGAYKPVDESLLEELDAFRKTLAHTFKNRNPRLDSETLTEITQRTLDRLVFLRFLEDKQIETPSLVDKFGSNGAPWEEFIAASRRLDGIYNGVVFKKHDVLDAPTFRADEDAFANICERLCHVNSAYNFDAIPIHILGSIYERFLGKVIVATRRRASVEDKPEVRKAGGVYYTPEYIVRYIVEHTVGEVIADKMPEQIAEMRFGDIACGSGSFLLGVYDLLLAYHGRYYNENPGKARKVDCIEREGRLYLSLRKKREILLNNVFGVDIDAQAVEVCQLSLYLKLLKDETTASAHQYLLEFEHTAQLKRLLPDLSRNVVCGNSVIGRDVGRDLFGEEARRLNAMDFKDAFPEVIKRGGFDAIVGNPPYVRMEEFKPLKDYLRDHYKSHDERTDLYVYFVEQSLRLLRKDGLYGVIVSNKWLRSKYGSRLRGVVGANASPLHMIDFGELPVFQKAATFPVVFVARRGVPDSNESFSFTDALDKATFRRVQSGEITLLQAETEKSTRLPSNKLATGDWRFGAPDSDALLNRMRSKGKTLWEYTGGKIRYGIKTGLVKAFIIDNATRQRLLKRSPAASRLIRPYVIGDDVRKYHIRDSDRYLIYTHHSIDMKGCASVLRHLGKFKARLVKRATKQEWYELQQPQYAYLPDYESAKIVYPDIAKESRFALDTEGLYPADTTFSIPLADLYLLGILNSRAVYFYLSAICPVLGDARVGGRLRLKLNYVQTLPIPIADKARREEIVNKVEAILAAKKEFAKVKTDKDKTYYENLCASLDRQIDQIVYGLYGLSADEIQIVEAGR